MPFHFNQHKACEVTSALATRGTESRGAAVRTCAGHQLIASWLRIHCPVPEGRFPSSWMTSANVTPLPVRSGSQRGGKSRGTLPRHPRKQRERQGCSRRSSSRPARGNTFRADLPVLRSGPCWRGHARVREVLWCFAQGTCWKSLWACLKATLEGTRRSCPLEGASPRPEPLYCNSALGAAGRGQGTFGCWVPSSSVCSRPSPAPPSINRKTGNVACSLLRKISFYISTTRTTAVLTSCLSSDLGECRCLCTCALTQRDTLSPLELGSD